jgi:hypothetical protein
MFGKRYISNISCSGISVVKALTELLLLSRAKDMFRLAHASATAAQARTAQQKRLVSDLTADDTMITTN